MPPNALKYYSIITILLFFSEILSNDISIENIQSILNTYMVIQIAIASIAFVAMSMKAAEKNKLIYNNLFALSLFSIFTLSINLLVYYGSFFGTTNYFMLKLAFAAMTWMTFLSFFFVISSFMLFNPNFIKENEEEI